MAYLGLVYPVIARYTEDEDGNPVYSGGVVVGKAIKAEINPVYEDITEYSDMNELDYEQEFSYAEITLNTTDIPDDAEGFLGHDDTGEYSDLDYSRNVGIGLARREVLDGEVSYSTIWLYKAKLWEGDHSAETRGEDLNYNTPSVTGRAFPAANGRWKKVKKFGTKSEALDWLQEMAGMKGE